MMSSESNGAANAATSAVTKAEDTAELSFGAEFDDAEINILSNAQVAVILQMSAQSALIRDEELDDVYKKTQKYVERFNNMKNPEKDEDMINRLACPSGRALKLCQPTCNNTLI